MMRRHVRWISTLALGFAPLSGCSESELAVATVGDATTSSDTSVDDRSDSESDSSGELDVEAPGPDVNASTDTATSGDTTGTPVDVATGAEDTSGDEDIAEPLEDALEPEDVGTPDDTATPDTADVAIGTDAAADVGVDPGPLPPDPKLAGKETYDTLPLEIVITPGAFGESIDLTVFLPKTAGPRPTLVFTHGFQLSGENYLSTAKHLASHGFAVVLPNLGGGFSATHVDHQATIITVLDWLEEQNTAAGSDLSGRLDFSRLALGGHSMGGKIAFLVSTVDARPKAIVGFDPVDAAGGPVAVDPKDYPSVTPERMIDVKVPFLVVGETTNSTGGLLGQACAPAADNYQQYFDYAESPAIEFTFVGANHFSWLDDPNCFLLCATCDKGSDNPSVTKSLSWRFTVAFLQIVLNGDDSYEGWLVGAATQGAIDDGLVVRAVSDFPN
jgi:dienelactone hydrolase